MGPFKTPEDSKKYRKQALNECSEILKEEKPGDYAQLKINLFYPAAILFILIFLISTGLKLDKLNPEPVLFDVPAYTIKDEPLLLMAECRELDEIYLFQDNKSKRMEYYGNGLFGLIVRPKKNLNISAGYRTWKSDNKRIRVVSDLKIEKLFLKYIFPPYLSVEPIYDTISTPDMVVPVKMLEETEIEFSGFTNKILGKVEGNVEKVRKDGNKFGGEFKTGRDSIFHVILKDTLLYTDCRLNFAVMPIKDNPPRVSIISPSGDYKLDESMMVNIESESSDDYGLKRISVISGKTEKSASYPGGARFSRDSFSISVPELLPSETLTVYLAAYDIAGNRSLSTPIRIFMPPIEEIFGNLSDLSDSLSTEAEDIRDREKEIIEEIEEIISRASMDEETRYRLRETLEKQSSLLEEIERMASLAEKMSNPRMMEEMQKIKELMEEMGVEELKQQLEDMKEKGDLTTEDLENLKLTQEELLSALELGRKSLESMKELMELNRYIEEAENLYKEETDLLKGKPGDSLASKQENLASRLDSLIKNMRGSDMKEVRRIGEEAVKQMISQKMSEMASQMKQGQISKGEGDEIKSMLAQLRKSLNELKENRMGEEVQKIIKRKARELGFILNIHEFMKNEEPGVKQGLMEQGLKEGIDRIEKDLETLFISSFAFSPEILKYLSEASKRMSEISREFVREKPMISSMRRVNDLLCRSIVGLLSNPPSSPQSMMNALNNIMKKQKGISNKIQSIIPMPSGKRMDMMKNLGKKQKELAQKVRELGEAMNPLAEEMERLSEEMKKGKLDRELMERQREVLDRLLTARESIRRKGISRKRRSEPGIMVIPPPSELPQHLGEERRKIRKIIERKMKEPFPEVYKEEIKNYIRKLLE